MSEHPIIFSSEPVINNLRRNMEKIEKPENMPIMHWILCNIFALNFAQQHGWFDGVVNYTDVSEDDHGYDTFQRGLNIAVVTYNFWTKHLKFK